MAIRFDGDDGYSATVNWSYANFTVACWFRMEDLTNFHYLWSLGETGDATHFFAVAAGGSDGDPILDPLEALTFGGTLRRAFSTLAYSENIWEHAIASFTGVASRSIWLNNANTHTDSLGVGAISQDVFGIGFSIDSTPLYATGAIAEVALWDVNDLTASERQMLVDGFSPLFVRPGNLVLYTPLIRNVVDLIGGATFGVTGNPAAYAHPPIIYPAPPMVVVPAAAVGGDTLNLTLEALTWAGGTISVNYNIPLTLEALTLTEGTITPKVTKTLTQEALTWTGGTLKVNQVVKLVQEALTWTGGTITARVTKTLVLETLNWVGGTVSVNARTTLTLVLEALTWTGGTVTVVTGAVLKLTREALTWTGGTLKVNLFVRLVREALTIGGGIVSIAREAVGKGLSKLGLSTKLE